MFVEQLSVRSEQWEGVSTAERARGAGTYFMGHVLSEPGEPFR
jgi:hypothetical protein